MALRQRKPPPNDYLKYWRVVRKYIRSKYSLNQADLDMLLFLYSERYFTRDKFREFDALIPWNVDRFNDLLRDGWIVLFRPYDRSKKQKAIYEISYRGRRMIGSMYKMLNGEEIPMSQCNNSMFAKKVSYSEERYKQFIKKLNSEIKQQRHPSPE